MGSCGSKKQKNLTWADSRNLLTRKSHGRHGAYRAHSKREQDTKNGRQRQNYKNYRHEHKSQKATVITMKQEVTGSWLNLAKATTLGHQGTQIIREDETKGIKLDMKAQR